MIPHSITTILHLFTSGGTARILSMHYNSTGDWLKPIECIQDRALIISIFVLSELATCSTMEDKIDEVIYVFTIFLQILLVDIVTILIHPIPMGQGMGIFYTCSTVSGSSFILCTWSCYDRKGKFE
jgi:hypothetical protein